MSLLGPNGLETLMIMGQPAPFVRVFIDAVDDAIRAHQPHHGMSAVQRAWLAFCVTAVLVTNSLCWARFERASLGTYTLAALARMLRHSKIPWDDLSVASVWVLLHHHRQVVPWRMLSRPWQCGQSRTCIIMTSLDWVEGCSDSRTLEEQSTTAETPSASG